MMIQSQAVALVPELQEQETQAAPILPELHEQQTISKPTASPASYSVAIGYLRAFVTVLVLAYHSVLAYYPLMPAPALSVTAVPWLWQAFPVLDAQRWAGFAMFAAFNDKFFMSLMFFLSGLFVWPSLQRKGAAGFLRDRLFRLGLPFLVVAAFIAPVAYYPAFLQAGMQAHFWHRWLSLGNWPTGPGWFLWLLLAFDCVAAALFVMTPRLGEALGRFLTGAFRRPFIFFLLLAAISSLVYIPMVRVFTTLHWTTFGPFAFQTSRILHYFAYFLIAVGIGASGIESGLLASEGRLAVRWPFWAVAALGIFCVASFTEILALVEGGLIPNKELDAIVASTAKSWPHLWQTIGSFGFAFSCAASCFAFLALFVRFSKRANRIGNSFHDNAYGMYAIHYAIAIWIQYALLKPQLSAQSKGFIVILCTIGFSWAAIAVLRRIPLVARVI